MFKVFAKLKVIFLLLLVVLPFFAFAQPEAMPEWENVYISYGNDRHKINMQQIGEKNYLFLPPYIPFNAVPLRFQLTDPDASVTVGNTAGTIRIQNSNTLDLSVLCGGEPYQLSLTAENKAGVSVLDLTIVPIQNTASLQIESSNPTGQGREWVESSPDKENKATGSLLMIDDGGTVVYDGGLSQIKGRGHSTWNMEKKPYQIKLAQKTDLLQTANEGNAARTWVLLANAADPSLIRNNIVYDLSTALHMQPGIESRPVALFYDGEFRGAYLLCEKVQINPGRVDINELEKSNEEANPTFDPDTAEIKTGRTENNASYVYCDGMNNPQDISGGYLLELEHPDRVVESTCYFVTARNQYIVVKSPECCSREQMDYIASCYQDFEDAAFNQGIHPDTGLLLEDYADLTSLAQCYLINELAKNPDGFHTSTFFYKDAGNHPFVAAPVWDFDNSFGRGWGVSAELCRDPENFLVLHAELCDALYQIPAFRMEVRDKYVENVLPLLNTLLSEGIGGVGVIQSLPGYKNEIAAVAYADSMVWQYDPQLWADNVSELGDYIAARQRWLTDAFRKWNAERAEPNPEFIDISTESWFYPYVQKACQYNLMEGHANRVFAPYVTASRAQAVKILFEMRENKEEIVSGESFPDVSVFDWFAPTAAWAKQNGIISGGADGLFHPKDYISRQDMATFLYRFSRSPEPGDDCLSGFSDADEIPSYARDAMNWAIREQLISGYTDGALHPGRSLNRAELATLCVRFYEKIKLTHPLS